MLTSSLRRFLPLFVALSVLAVPGAAGAATVTLNAEQVRQRLFVSADVGRVGNPLTGTRDLVLEAVLQEMYAIDPDLANSEAVDAIRAIQDRAPSGASDGVPGAANERLLATLLALDTPHPAGVLGAALARVGRRALIESVDAGTPGDRFTPGADRHATLLGKFLSPSRVLAHTAALGQSNSAFAVARDALWQESAGVSVDSTQAELLATPVLQEAMFDELRSSIRPDGSLEISDSGLIAEHLDQANAIQEIKLEIVTVTQGEFDASKQQIDAAARRRQEIIAARMAASTFATQALSEVSSREAGMLGDIAMAEANEASAMAEIEKRELGKKVVQYAEAVTNIAVGIISNGQGGDPIGGVSSLIQLGLSEGAPSVEELILAQLAAIRQQIVELTEMMHERFDQVTDHLNKLDSRLGDLQAAITTVNGNVKLALDAIQSVSVQLDRLAANIYAQSQADADRGIYQTIRFALGYQEESSTGDPLPAGEFQRAAALFSDLGIRGAKDSSYIVPNRSFAAADIATELRTVALEANTDYLRLAPQILGLPALGTSTVVNARAWSLAARAYSQLLLENPQYITGAQRSELEQIRTEGQRLSGVISAISREDAATRTHSELFNRLLGLLAARIGKSATPSDFDSLTQAITKVEDDFMLARRAPNPHQLPPNQDSVVPIFDLFGGPDQLLGASEVGTIDAMVPRCDTVTDKLQPPPGLNWRAFATKELLLAQRLGLYVPQMCWTAEWFNCKNDDTCQMRVRWNLKAPKTGQTTQVPIVAYAEFEYGTDCAWDCVGAGANYMDVYRDLEHSWAWEGADRDCNAYKDPPCVDGKRKKFPASPTIVRDPLVESTIRNDAMTKLETLQRDMYDAIAASAASGTVLQAVKRLASAEELLEAYIDLGLSRQVAADSGLQLALRGDGRFKSGAIQKFYKDASLSGSSIDPAKNLRTDLLTSLEAPLPEVERRLQAIITGIEPAPPGRRAAARAAAAVPVTNPLVGTTLTRLALTANASVAPPPAATPPAGPPPADPPSAPVVPLVQPTVIPALVTPSLATVKLPRAFKSKKGTKLSFVLSEAGVIEVTLLRETRGRKVGRRCKTTAKRGKKCVALVRAKRFTIKATKGPNRVSFGRKLARGRYRAEFRVRGAAASAKPLVKKFKVS